MVNRLHRSIVDTKEFTAIQEVFSADGTTKKTQSCAETRWDGEFDSLKNNNNLKEPLTILFSGELQDQHNTDGQLEAEESGESGALKKRAF